MLRKIIVVNNNSPGFDNIITVLNNYNLAKVVEIHQKDIPNTLLSDLIRDTYAIILSGGFEHVNPKAKEVLAEKELIDLAMTQKIPILGICYGFQLISHFYGKKKLEKLGGLLTHAVKIQLLKNDVIFHEVDELIANQHHEEYIPFTEDNFGDFQVLAVSDYHDKKVVEAIKSNDGLIYGVQFHPERMSDEANADRIIFNFLDMFL